MKTFRWHFILFLLLPFALFAQTPQIKDTTLVMSDGIVIDALYVVPATPPPANGYPAILSIHGFAGSKDQLRNTVNSFAGEGYVATAYSVRGQGASGGVFDFFNSGRILDDLRELVQFTKDLPNVNDDRIGVFGGSQGGLHAWAASAYHLDVRAVISMIANGRFLENWTENNAMNFTFAATMTTSPVNIAPQIRNTVQTAVNTNDIGPVQQMLQPFSTAGLERNTQVPVLMVFSYYDQFFNPTPGLRQFHLIKAPKRAITYAGEHSLSTDPTVNTAIVITMAEWFDYWLKDNQAAAHIVSEDNALLMFDGGTETPHYYAATDTAIWLETDWNAPGVRPFKLWFNKNGTLDTSAAVDPTTPFHYIGGLGGDKAVFRSAPMGNDVLLVGANSYVNLVSSGTASRYQANVELYDYNPATGSSRRISRGHYQQNDNTPGQPNLWRFYLNAMNHTVQSGHQIEARLHGGCPALFTPTNNDVLATGRTSQNTLVGGGQASCYIQLYSYDRTTISVDAVESPSTVHLAQNYPNPFGPGSVSGASATFIEYTTTSNAATLEVYNSMGQRITSLHSAGSGPGTHTAQFSAESLPAGVYFAVLRDGNVREVMLMVVVR